MLLKLASKQDQVLSVRELAEAQGVPYSFARSIQRDLVQAGLIKTTRGATGGTVLARPADEINLFHVVDAIQGPVVCAVCTKDPAWCERQPGCKVHRIWTDINEMLIERLNSTLISDLL